MGSETFGLGSRPDLDLRGQEQIGSVVVQAIIG
jgi:hypothetical protein